MIRKTGHSHILTILTVIILLIFSIKYFSSTDSSALTVYCAHDSVYAKKILQEFQKDTGIRITAKFDTESTKSIGLIQLIKKEENHPRCDLFWNNEILGTMALKEEGLLLPYKGKGYKRIPEKFKDPDGYWVGFAARLRVYIINKDLISSTNKIANELQENSANFAIAKPLYGTTLTHFTCIAQEKGVENLKNWYCKIKKQGVKIVNGNAAVKNAVAMGGCIAGWTDTDDFFSAKFAGKHVEMLPIKLKNNKTISIPNTVAIIAGTKHLKMAKRLADFLLSEKCELMLANSRSRQIPLGKVDLSKLPEEVIQLKKWNNNALTLTEELLPTRTQCINFLKSELNK